MTEGSAFEAVVRRVDGCPLEFEEGERMTVRLPGVDVPRSDRVCALALCDLVPVIQELQKNLDREGSADLGQGIFCTGCMHDDRHVEFDVVHRPGLSDDLSPEVKRRAEALARFSVFRDVPPSERAAVVPAIQREEVDEGEVVLREGEPGERLHLVVDGEVTVVTVDEDDVEQVLGTLGPGECFGEMSILTGEPVSATIRAAAPSTLATLAREDLEELLERCPALNRRFTKLLAERLRDTSRSLVDDLASGVTGSLHMIDAPELIQALHVTSRTGRLEVRSRERTLAIAFVDGQAHAIEPGGETADDPEDAFHEFLDWTRGSFRFEPGEPVAERTFHQDVTSLLLEGMRRKDEAGGVSPSSPGRTPDR